MRGLVSFLRFLLFVGSQICSSSGSVDIDMLRLPAGFNARRSKRSGGEAWCLLSRAAQTEAVHHDQLWHLDNGDGHVCSHLTLRKVSGEEDGGLF